MAETQRIPSMQNYFLYFVPLLFGLGFIALGIHFARTSWASSRGQPAQFEKLKRATGAIFYVLFVLAGILLVVMILSSPTVAQRNRMARVLFHSDPQEVSEIEIQPANPAYGELVSAPVRITDRAAIERLCQALATAEPYSHNHPQSIWACELVLKVGDERIQCDVLNSSNNGLTITIVAGAPMSMNCGTYRADSVAQVATELAKQPASALTPDP